VSFPPLPADRVHASVWLEAGAPGHGRERVRASWHALVHGEPPVVTLYRGATVRGRVVDEKGVPVVAAAVSVVGQTGAAASGPDGRFEVAGLPPGGGVVLVRAADFAPTLLRDLKGDAGDVDVGDVTLRKGDRVNGIVLAADGTPVQRAVVRAWMAGVEEALDGTVSADDGRFVLERLPPEPLTIEALEPSEGKQWAAGLKTQVEDVRPGGGDVRLVLSSAATVHVRFLSDENRTPVLVSSVKLSATPVGATPEPLAWVWSGRGIDAVRFQPDHTGVFDVTIEVPDYEPGVARAVEVAPDRETRIDVLFRKRPR
jgi:hypothetical protein